MVDKDTILQVLCGLMKNPQLLSETDKYRLTPDDFTALFEKIIFSSIYNLYKDGAQKITVFDIDTYLNTHKASKATFEKNKGIEYLQDGLDFVQEENFPFYYKRLKKFNCLRDLKKEGYDISRFYEPDYSNPKAKEINEKFEKMEVSDIFNSVRKSFIKVETDYSLGEGTETTDAIYNLRELLDELKVKPEVGVPLQGDIFNTICRGARKTKFYIRSSSSGVGKTRLSLGDACNLSYPVKFNTENWRWEWTGANEKTLFIATEQELSEIQTLILAFLTGFNEEKILYSSYNSEEYKIVKQAVKIMEHYKDNLFIVRLANPNIEQVKAVVKQNWVVNNIQNVFYDYIFSSPSLLNEFRDLNIREDVALAMFSTALKDLAVDLGLFVMSSTQTNAKSEDGKPIKNEAVIRGSRAIIDKCDVACVVSRVTKEDLALLEAPISVIGCAPNQVTDIYKVRRGRYTNVKVWSYTDLGTCRKKDLFITDDRYNAIVGFECLTFNFEEADTTGIVDFLKDLNDSVENDNELELNSRSAAAPKIDLEDVVAEDNFAKGGFGELL